MSNNGKFSEPKMSPTDKRSIGFLPSYLPNEYLNTNSSSSTGPPYPCQPLVSINVTPPTPTDELLETPIIPSNSGKSSEAANVSENSTKKIASAPTIDEIEYKIGITDSERNEIIEEFEKMRNNVYKVEGGTAMLSAEKRIYELLLIAKTRLTQTEKDDYLTVVSDIKKERQAWINRKIKIRKIKQKKKCDTKLTTIFLKCIAIITGMYIFINCHIYKKQVNMGYFYPFVITSLIFTIGLTMLNAACNEFLSYPVNITCSLLFAMGYLFVNSGTNDTIIILSYSMGVVYILDLIFTVIPFCKISSSEKLPTIETASSMQRPKSRQTNSLSNSHHSNDFSQNHYYSPTVVQKYHYTTNEYNSSSHALPAGVNYTLSQNYSNQTDDIFDNEVENDNDDRADDNDKDNSGEDYGGCDPEGRDYVSENYGGCNSVIEDYGGGYSGGGDYGGGDSGGGDYGGGDYGGGDYGGGDYGD